LVVLTSLLLLQQGVYAQVPTDRILGNLVFEQTDAGQLQLKGRWANLGLFGMHRLYLGTNVKVPVAYTLTFGGGGVLWLVDLVLLISSPDIESYKNNPHLFMWIPNEVKRSER